MGEREKNIGKTLKAGAMLGAAVVPVAANQAAGTVSADGNITISSERKENETKKLDTKDTSNNLKKFLENKENSGDRFENKKAIRLSVNKKTGKKSTSQYIRNILLKAAKDPNDKEAMALVGEVLPGLKEKMSDEQYKVANNVIQIQIALLLQGNLSKYWHPSLKNKLTKAKIPNTVFTQDTTITGLKNWCEKYADEEFKQKINKLFEENSKNNRNDTTVESSKKQVTSQQKNKNTAPIKAPSNQAVKNVVNQKINPNQSKNKTSDKSKANSIEEQAQKTDKTKIDKNQNINLVSNKENAEEYLRRICKNFDNDSDDKEADQFVNLLIPGLKEKLAKKGDEYLIVKSTIIGQIYSVVGFNKNVDIEKRTHFYRNSYNTSEVKDELSEDTKTFFKEETTIKALKEWCEKHANDEFKEKVNKFIKTMDVDEKDSKQNTSNYIHQISYGGYNETNEKLENFINKIVPGLKEKAGSDYAAIRGVIKLQLKNLSSKKAGLSSYWDSYIKDMLYIDMIPRELFSQETTISGLKNWCKEHADEKFKQKIDKLYEELKTAKEEKAKSSNKASEEYLKDLVKRFDDNKFDLDDYYALEEIVPKLRSEMRKTRKNKKRRDNTLKLFVEQIKAVLDLDTYAYSKCLMAKDKVPGLSMTLDSLKEWCEKHANDEFKEKVNKFIKMMDVDEGDSKENTRVYVTKIYKIWCNDSKDEKVENFINEIVPGLKEKAGDDYGTIRDIIMCQVMDLLDENLSSYWNPSRVQSTLYRKAISKELFSQETTISGLKKWCEEHADEKFKQKIDKLYEELKTAKEEKAKSSNKASEEYLRDLVKRFDDNKFDLDDYYALEEIVPKLRYEMRKARRNKERRENTLKLFVGQIAAVLDLDTYAYSKCLMAKDKVPGLSMTLGSLKEWCEKNNNKEFKQKINKFLECYEKECEIYNDYGLFLSIFDSGITVDDLDDTEKEKAKKVFEDVTKMDAKYFQEKFRKFFKQMSIITSAENKEFSATDIKKFKESTNSFWDDYFDEIKKFFDGHRENFSISEKILSNLEDFNKAKAKFSSSEKNQ